MQETPKADLFRVEMEQVNQDFLFGRGQQWLHLCPSRLDLTRKRENDRRTVESPRRSIKESRARIFGYIMTGFSHPGINVGIVHILHTIRKALNLDKLR